MSIGGFSKLPESADDEAFKVADANHDGKIDREELNTYEFKFWFETGAIGQEAKGFLDKNLRPTKLIPCSLFCSCKLTIKRTWTQVQYYYSYIIIPW